MDKQHKQVIHNPLTGEMMEANTYSGKELFWDNERTPDDKSDVPEKEKTTP